MSVFLFTIVLLVSSILFSIAVAAWQKGGYANYWASFYWGIAGFVLLGVGLFFGYYAYVIAPAKRAKPARESAYVTVSDSKLERAINAGDYPTLYFTINNGPLPVRGTIRNISVYYCGVNDQIFPWGQSLTKSFALMPNERTTAIFRFNDVIFTDEQITALTQEKARLLFYFRGEFTDDYRRTYPMKHCFIWNKYMGVNLALCGDDIKLD